MLYERRNGDFILTTDPARIDVFTVEQFLRGTYWAADRPRERIARTLETSLCFIVRNTRDDRAVAFSRVVTDYADFAWLCDVVVDDAFRGNGIGKWMIGCVLEHPDLLGLRRIILATSDAHTLYARHGFTALEKPAIWMERR
jgi:GNAT superfamily N-acetyltransferase